MSQTALLIAALAFFGILTLLARRSHRRSVERERKWDAKPTLYSAEELRRMYLEYQELEDAGLLDADQPTEWSHAAHRIYTKGSYKDKVLLRLSTEGEEGES